MTSALLTLLLCAPAPTGIDTAVVCPAEFRQALEPWVRHRRSQGHRVAVISNQKSPVGLRSEVRRIAAAGELRYLLLVGDADPAMHANSAVRRRCVPAHYAKAVVNVQYGSTSEIATDNWYADLDDDRVPEIAVGRLTCDSAEELSRMVEKILGYERSADFGPWRRQVHFVAGLGGFGPMADTVLEAAAKSLISGGIPSAYSTTMTYASWQSPYCPDPRDFKRVTLARLNEGSLFWVYIGHGQQCAVDEVRVPGGQYPILSTADTAGLRCRHGAPIACFLACYSGAFDQPRDCLAEEMLKSSGGPVAILCGSRVTMPYGMSVLGTELLEQCFTEQPGTLGEAILQAKRRMMRTDNPSSIRAALDAIAGVISPTSGQLEAERAEHLDLFNLLGDPLLRVAYPRAIEVAVAPSAAAGGIISVSLTTPLAGSGVVELAVRRDRLSFKPPRRDRFDPDALAGYDEIYRMANEPRLTSTPVALGAGSFTTQLAVPAEARGSCHVRVFLAGPDGCAAGAAGIHIEEQSASAPDR
ncbi:MAG: C25 family cysteine peptidase [Pirellulales bacterium]